jgi:hypothetical protein
MNCYCKKCGLRADSKCPHCRNVFPKRLSPAQQCLEMIIKVKQVSNHDIPTRWVYVEIKKSSEEEAILSVLETLKACFDAGADLKVAACVHEWELMPGVESEIGCGCVGPHNVVVPADPFESVGGV